MNGGVGYYRPTPGRSDTRESGTVQLGKGQSLAVETMMRLVRSSHAYDPLGVYVPWGRQNGGVIWDTIANPDHELVIYPISARDVDRVNAHSYGSELPWVAVLTETPVNSQVADEVWDESRYDLFAVEGVYDITDPRPTPRICFLYWAKLHEDVGGGRASLDSIARRLGGVLVFPSHLPLRPGRSAPGLSFQLALSAQLAAASLPPAPVGIGVDTVALAPVAPPAASRLGFGILAAAAAATGYVFWATVHPRHSANGRRRRR